jgi:hypothetical protein
MDCCGSASRITSRSSGTGAVFHRLGPDRSQKSEDRIAQRSLCHRALSGATRALLVRAQEGRALVRQGRGKLDHLGVAVGKSRGEAGGVDAQTDRESSAARRGGVRPVPGERHAFVAHNAFAVRFHVGRGGIDQAGLLRDGAGSQVRGQRCTALADAVGEAGHARRRRPEL